MVMSATTDEGRVNMLRNRFLYKTVVVLSCIVIALWMCKKTWQFVDFIQRPQLLQGEPQVTCRPDALIQSCVPLLSQAITLLRRNMARLSAPSRVSARSQKGSRPDRQRDGLEAERGRTQTKPFGTTEASRRVPVFVVEEHHEVIPYWFSAADKGILQRQGNVLFHIDGHSDGAPPIELDNVPLFRWPGAEERRHLMQENDMFIFSAALTGLVNRYIWIAPPWDTALIRLLPAHYLRVEVDIGTTRTPRPDRRHGSSNQTEDTGQSGNQYGEQLPVVTDKAEESAAATEEEDGLQSEKRLCICIVQLYTNSTEDDCLWIDHYQLRVTREMTDTSIPRNMCDVSQRVLVEVTTASKAAELLTRPPTHDAPFSWLSPSDSVILDIDEDFYGCEAAIGPLLGAGLSADQVDEVSQAVARMFCPSSVLYEQLADGFFNSLLQSVRSVLQATCRSHSSDLTRQRQLQALAEDLAKDLKRRGLLACVCRDTSSLQTRMQHLVDILARLNPEQLTALTQVGICLHESPMTDGFDPSTGMIVCTGYNRPNRTMVLFHSPTTAEVLSTTRLLGGLLGKFSVQPRVVSICRSVRDGYTPRAHFRRIEKDVLDLLKQSFEGVGGGSIEYDQNLLGGRTGWPDRH